MNLRQLVPPAICVALLSVGTLYPSCALGPQQNPKPGPDSGASTIYDVPSPDQRLAKMIKKYNLTSDQQSRIKPILEDEQQQMQAMHSDTSMAPKDRHAKMMSMRREDSQKIEAVLNDDQKKMFEADQQKMEQKMAMHHQHMQGGDQTNQSAPPQQ